MFLNALPKTEAECPPGTNIYDDSCVLEGSGFAFDMDKYDGCGAGAMMCNGVCVGVGAPTAERPDPYKCPDVEKVITTGGGINPALILAAAAAYFFAG